MGAIVLLLFVFVNFAIAEDFRIPRGPLEQVLISYSEVTGKKPVYMNSLVEGKESPGVTGIFSSKKAMSKILEGTGLTFILTDDGNMVIQKAVNPESSFFQNNTSLYPDTYVEQVVITATKTPVKTKEVPTSISVVTSEDLKLKGRTDDFFEAIQNVPGVATDESNSMGWPTMFIRGELPSILINGRNVRHAGGYTLDSALMGMGAVERIEVLKGPQSTMYGGRAIAGTINIITKKGDKDQPYAACTVPVKN